MKEWSKAMKKIITSGDLIKLGAMECAASCIMTALHITGLDYRYFMLSYWNLTYTSKIIMSAKNIIRTDLLYTYGIKKEFMKGNEQNLIELMQGNHMAVLPCHASKLHFFPRIMLGHESHGFHHFILLYDYFPQRESFLVIDPIAEFIGEISTAELWESSVSKHELIYYTLELPNKFEQPSIDQIFIRESATNVMRYGGDKVITKFIEDIKECIKLEQDERNTWIDQNNVTITSIVKTRSLVWQSFCSLNRMTADDVEIGNQLIEAIVKLWTTVNFLLIKMKRSHKQAEIVTTIEDKLLTLKAKERECLEFIKRKGGELAAI